MIWWRKTDCTIYFKTFSDTFFSIETIEGGRDGAIFYVDKIDRDTLEKELFQLSIIAYKADNDSYAMEANIAIIVNDINDQIPKPLIEEYHISILEETALTLNFLQDFGFHDRDLVSFFNKIVLLILANVFISLLSYFDCSWQN